MEMDEFDLAVEIFHQRRATFNPIAVIEIKDTIDRLHSRMVNMSANDTVIAFVPGIFCCCFFEVGNKLDGFLHLFLDEARQRPVRQAQAAPNLLRRWNTGTGENTLLGMYEGRTTLSPAALGGYHRHRSDYR